MCHSQSQATNTLHEMTHALAGTADHAYGMDGIMGLSSEQAVSNADTYALYATGTYSHIPQVQSIANIQQDLDLNCGTGNGNGGSGGPASGSWGSQNGGTSWVQQSQGSPEQSEQNDGEEAAPKSQPTSSNGGYSWDDILAWFRKYRSG